MNNIAIKVENLSKLYHIGRTKQRHDTLRDAIVSTFQHSNVATPDDTLWALRYVSFEVKRGEVVGIIGRNGAGKSTLLKILSRITEPTSGRAEIHGRVGSLLEVGTGFHPELTGRENIFLNGAILGMKRTEISRKFDEIVAFAEIEKFLDTPVKRYSSGMYVRLAFAVAAHLEPEILLVDEVLAVGDAAFQKKCLGKMGDVAKEGQTVLFVSHNMAAVTQLCQRGIWLNDGHIVKSGLSQEVVEAYLSADNTQIAKQRWSYPGDAPGDDRVRLLACHILQNEQPTAVIDINVPCHIEMEFEVLRKVRNLVTGINLYNIEGICIFASCDWRPNQLVSGTYRKHTNLPAHFLAEGQYTILVQLVFYDPDIKSVIVPNALCFDAIDSDHPMAVRGPYKGAWPGLVRPHLSWSDTHQISHAVSSDDEIATPLSLR